MFETKNDELFPVILGIGLIAFLYSLLTYGYMAWFKPEDFIKWGEERKKKAPRWFRPFMRSPTRQDLWIIRGTYLAGCILILFVLMLLFLK